jgi:long-chain fatty acid transport protein
LSAARRSASCALALSLALAAGAAARAARANPLGMYGYGSRSTALAGGVSADVSDPSANYYNPAGLVRGTRMQFLLGYFYAAHFLQSNGHDTGVDPAHGIVGGLTAPGRLFGLPFAFGLGFHLPDDRLSRSRSLPQAQPRWELYDNRVQILYIAANVAIQPWPWLRLGAGLSFVSSTRGRLDISGNISFTRPNDSQLFHTVDADLTAVRYPQLGMQVDVLPNLTVGAVYRGAFALQLQLDALVHGSIVIGGINDPNATRIPGAYALQSSSTAVYLPQQGVFGLAWNPRSDVTVVADVTWVNWAAYFNPTALLTASLSLTIPPGLGNFRSPTVPPPTAVLPAAFHDTFVPRIGAEWRRGVGVHTFALRAGYRFDPTPVPDQRGATNFMDANRHVVSLGAGFVLRGLRPTLAGGLSFDVHAETQFLERRAVLKDDPADPVGDYVIGGYVLDVGASVTVLF